MIVGTAFSTVRNLMLGLGGTDIFSFLSSADADGDTILGVPAG